MTYTNVACPHCGGTQHQLVTIAEAARFLGVSHQRTRHFIDDGRLTVVGNVAHTRLLDAGQVERLAAERALNPPRPGRPRKAVAS